MLIFVDVGIVTLLRETLSFQKKRRHTSLQINDVV